VSLKGNGISWGKSTGWRAGPTSSHTLTPHTSYCWTYIIEIGSQDEYFSKGTARLCADGFYNFFVALFLKKIKVEVSSCSFEITYYF
jgi:hypothetical protein